MPTPNDAMIKGMESYFPRLSSPSYTAGNVASLFLQLPFIRAYWPMSANGLNAGAILLRDVAGRLDLTVSPSCSLGYDRLAPYASFLRASSQYAAYPDNEHFDVIGTEAYMLNPGLTLGGWLYFDSLVSGQGIASKYYSTTNQRAYRLYQSDAGGSIRFSVSNTGAADISVTIAAATSGMIARYWRFIVARYSPSRELKIWNNSTTNEYYEINTTSIPASLFNSTEPFELARSNRTGYFNGKFSNWFFAAGYLSDSQIWNLWQNTRYLYI